MPDALLLALALVCAEIGMGWLALAMEVHWKQVREASPRSRRSAILLRTLGSASLVAALVFCLRADTATMAVLVWMMLLATSAFAVAATLSARPHWLTPLAWAAGGR